MTLKITRQRSLNALVTGLFVLALAGALPAQEALLVLDPAQTHIDFTLGDVLHTVHGRFKLRQGTIHVDPATGAATGSVLVDATSGDSGNGARDRKMHKDILESQKYPEITLTPIRIQGHLSHQEVSQIELQGFFKIHGTEHEITLKIAVQVAADQLTAAAHFVVPYVQWGMKNPSTFILRVSDKVDIEIHAVGRLTFTPEQRQKLEDIRFNSEKETIQHRSSLQIQHLELSRLINADNPDRAAIDKKIQEVAQEEAALMRSSINARLNARGVLTAEQRAKWAQRMQNPMPPGRSRSEGAMPPVPPAQKAGPGRDAAPPPAAPDKPPVD